MILAKVNPCIPTYYDKDGKPYWKIADVINPICPNGLMQYKKEIEK